jgi:hypothetical protein
LVTVFADVVSNLHKQRTIAKGCATFDTLAAGYAFVLINFIFKVRVLDIGTTDGVGRTTKIFSSSIEFVPFVLIVSATEKAITAGSVLMNTPDCRMGQDAFRLTFAALRAFIRINLPKCFALNFPII